MTDIEMVRLCAQAMGYRDAGLPASEPAVRVQVGHEVFAFDPLRDDAQAMALVKNVELMIWPPRFNKGKVNWIVRAEDDNQNVIAQTTCPDLNRAIVETVAKMQSA